MLSDLYPLLRTVEPAELNMTLNALATALEGRGDQLGQNLETVDSYLKRLNPQIPALVEDLRLTASVSDTYADVLPQVGDDPAQHRHDHRHPRGPARPACTSSSTTSPSSPAPRGRFLDDNGDNLIRLGEVSRAQLRVLARYSTEFPCLLGGIVNAGKLEAAAFRGFTLHIVLETLPNQPRGYTAADKPVLGEDRGPTCLHLPNPPWNQSNPVRRQPDFADGIDDPDRQGHQPGRHGVRRRRRERRPAGQLRRLRRLARGVRPARQPARPDAGHHRRPGARPRRPAARPDGPRRHRLDRGARR